MTTDKIKIMKNKENMLTATPIITPKLLSGEEPIKREDKLVTVLHNQST